MIDTWRTIRAKLNATLYGPDHEELPLRVEVSDAVRRLVSTVLDEPWLDRERPYVPPWAEPKR